MPATAFFFPCFPPAAARGAPYGVATSRVRVAFLPGPAASQSGDSDALATTDRDRGSSVAVAAAQGLGLAFRVSAGPAFALYTPSMEVRVVEDPLRDCAARRVRPATESAAMPALRPSPAAKVWEMPPEVWVGVWVWGVGA